jgi:peptidoglycan pentaglycine glycine transferase (the first glycine)
MTVRDEFPAPSTQDGLVAGLRTQISYERDDPEWDAFVAGTAGGRVAQTATWGQIKAPLGWRAARVIVKQGESIVAGAQLLIRRLPICKSVTYVPRGPLMARDKADLAELVMDGLLTVAREFGAQYLAVRPPRGYEALASQLSDRGFQSSLIQIEAEPTATVIVDLTQELDEILGEARPSTRYNIRLAQRKGLVVREGTEEDLDTFYRLLTITGNRQGFSNNPKEYFFTVWRLLSPRNQIKLFLTEVDGEAVSAILAIPFGDTVTNWRSAWSGRHGHWRPNELVNWEVMAWGKAHGYHYYDFEGIDQKIALAVARGEILPDKSQSLTTFKLGFGGEIVLYPGLFDYIPNPLMRWAYTTVFSKTVSYEIAARLVGAVRGLGSR